MSKNIYEIEYKDCRAGAFFDMEVLEVFIVYCWEYYNAEQDLIYFNSNEDKNKVIKRIEKAICDLDMSEQCKKEILINLKEFVKSLSCGVDYKVV